MCSSYRNACAIRNYAPCVKNLEFIHSKLQGFAVVCIGPQSLFMLIATLTEKEFFFRNILFIKVIMDFFVNFHVYL